MGTSILAALAVGFTAPVADLDSTCETAEHHLDDGSAPGPFVDGESHTRSMHHGEGSVADADAEEGCDHCPSDECAVDPGCESHQTVGVPAFAGVGNSWTHRVPTAWSPAGYSELSPEPRKWPPRPIG